ncbi:MAG: hypothetical protein U0547_14655 [Dehalococcoidia bacterium]
MVKSVPLLAVLGAVLFCAAMLTGGSTPARAASGPCDPASASISGEEQEFLGLLQAWRNANIANSQQLTLSAPLSAAAAWFAEYQVSHGAMGGHGDTYGRSFNDRARDCGYPAPYYNGLGEGVFGSGSSGGSNVPPSAAIIGITYPGSGVYITAGSPPVKCVGIAVARNQAGTLTAWVALIAQYPAGTACPQTATTTSPSPSPTTTAGASSPTATWTPTATTPAGTVTPTPTATATATPTPQVWRITMAQFACDSCQPAIGGSTPTPTPFAPTPTATTTVPSPTATTTVAATATPTATPSVTATQGPACGGGTAAITGLSKQGEWVDVTGTGNLTGWKLVSTGGNQEFAFPSGFLLNGTVRIRSGTDLDRIFPGELWWTISAIWNNSANDDAELWDCAGHRVSFFDDGQ